MGLVCPFTYYSSNRTLVCMVSLRISRPLVAYLNLSRFTGEVLCLENLPIKTREYGVLVWH